MQCLLGGQCRDGLRDHLAGAQPWGRCRQALGSGDRDLGSFVRASDSEELGVRTGCWDRHTARTKVACATRPPEVNFQVRSAWVWDQVVVGMGAGEAGLSIGVLGKSPLKKASEDRCPQQPMRWKGRRICDRTKELEVPLRRIPWLW